MMGSSRGISRAGTGFAWLLSSCVSVSAQQEVACVDLSGEDEGFVRLVLLFASVALVPALLAVLTSFARIIVVLLFLRAGIGAQEIPPTYVLIGLAILLTVVSMITTLQPIYEEAVLPLLDGESTLAEAVEQSEKPLRLFMGGQVRPADLTLMATLTEYEPVTVAEEAPLSLLAPAFAISELRAAFLIGFIIFLPFVIIDLVVASTLASIGMLSLPAPLLSLPFKILLFVMVDGWALLTEALVSTIV